MKTARSTRNMKNSQSGKALPTVSVPSNVVASCLVALPGELRNRIYSFCKNDGIVEVAHPRSRSKRGVDRTQHQFLGLTHVNKATRHEFMPIYRKGSAARVDLREVYDYISDVLVPSENTLGHAVGMEPCTANIIMDLSPALNHADLFVMDLLPLFQICPAKPDCVCKFALSQPVRRYDHMSDDALTKAHVQKILSDLNTILTRPTSIGTYQQKTGALEDTRIFITTVAVADLMPIAGEPYVYRQPYLEILFTKKPHWAQLGAETIADLQDEQARMFIRDAGLTEIEALPIRIA
ncbi:hypothetical protein EJ02DRAFT_512705 [Clathrospora elynae]|uniref:F-box domain-containing protein n=1 Tax=Clathrospora elynae TaxID=706981 RepID=A0A6A5SN53_9PLEO|nr:hypothetical protein EJ02DRAFT_512705 [Clathrospora elynae]